MINQPRNGLFTNRTASWIVLVNVLDQLRGFLRDIADLNSNVISHCRWRYCRHLGLRSLVAGNWINHDLGKAAVCLPLTILNQIGYQIHCCGPLKIDRLRCRNYLSIWQLHVYDSFDGILSGV